MRRREFIDASITTKPIEELSDSELLRIAAGAEDAPTNRQSH